MLIKSISQSVLIVSIAALLLACDAASPDTESQAKPAGTAQPQDAPKTRDVSGLDLLTDYDRDIWSGPDGWSDEQWAWKRALKWDRECDYVGEVHVDDVSAHIQLVTVQCVPGSYQPMSYVYLYDKKAEIVKALDLGLPEISETPQEIWGNIGYDADNKELSILSLSRGMGDCGIYRVFEISNLNTVEDANLSPKMTRQRACEDHGTKDLSQLPKEIFDYKKWPISG